MFMMPEKLIVDRNRAQSIKLYKSFWNQLHSSVAIDTKCISIGIVCLLSRFLLCFLRKNRNFHCSVLWLFNAGSIILKFYGPFNMWYDYSSFTL